MNLGNVNFKKINNDKFIFYPHGIFLKGYEVNLNLKQKLHSKLNKFYILGFSLIPLVAISNNYFKSNFIFLIAVFLAIIFYIYYSISVSHILKGSIVSEIKNNFYENMVRFSLTIGIVKLILFSIFMFLVSILILVTLFFFHDDLKMFILGVFLFVVTFSVSICYTMLVFIYKKFKDKRDLYLDAFSDLN